MCKVLRQHQGMGGPGVWQVPEGSGEQGNREKTGCKSICGAPTTLAVKGLMMMMKILEENYAQRGVNKRGLRRECHFTFCNKKSNSLVSLSLSLPLSLPSPLSPSLSLSLPLSLSQLPLPARRGSLSAWPKPVCEEDPVKVTDRQC